MATIVTETKNFPTAWGYVLANDTFLSGWGRANNAVNVVVLPVTSLEEANVVMQNAKNRTDMNYVRLARNKPRMKSYVVYSLMDREDADRWYQRGGFIMGDKE